MVQCVFQNDPLRSVTFNSERMLIDFEDYELQQDDVTSNITQLILV